MQQEPLYCSQGGIPYNKAHLDAKDAEIRRLRETEGLLREQVDNLLTECLRQRDENGRLQLLLNGRDDFIVRVGQWQAFTDSLPQSGKPAQSSLKKVDVRNLDNV